MTPAELDAALERIGWTAKHLARITGYPYHTVNNWRRGGVTIPLRVSGWLTQCLEWRDAMPHPPAPPRRRGFVTLPPGTPTVPTMPSSQR